MYIFLDNHFWQRKCYDSAVERFSVIEVLPKIMSPWRAAQCDLYRKCSWIFLFRNRYKYPGTKRLSWHSSPTVFQYLHSSTMLLNQCSMIHRWITFLTLLSQFFLMNESKRLLNAWVYILTNLMIQTSMKEIWLHPVMFFFQLIFQIIVLNNYLQIILLKCSKETQISLRHMTSSYVQLMNQSNDSFIKWIGNVF